MADLFEIKRAERSQAWLRIALAGASGAGKTWSGLVLSRGIVEALRAAGNLLGPLEGKIGVVDTERKSAQLYAHIVPFDVITMEPPYSPERYIGAIRALERAGCAVIMVDQISHAWAGAGGLLERMDKMTGDNQFAKFKDITPVQNQFVEDLLATNAHLIVTMRSKTEWVLEEYQDSNGRNKKRPKRIGMAPVQRAGVEYEFTTLCNLDTDTNRAVVLKDRTQVLDKLGPFVLTEDHGRRFVDWMLSGAQLEERPPEVPPLNQATAICESFVRQMEKAPTMPDMSRIKQNGQAAMAEFRERVPEADLRALVQRILDAGKKRMTELPNLEKATGQTGNFISPDDLGMLDDMLLQACLQPADLAGEMGVAKVGLLPHTAFDAACTWIINQAAMRHGVEIKRPIRKAQAVAPVKPMAQQMVDDEAKRRGIMAPLLDMQDDKPWEE